MFYKKVFTSVLLTVTFCLGCSNSLDYESAKEGVRCFVPQTVKTDMRWFMSVKKWFYVAMHKLDLYSFASDLTGRDPKDIQEDEVYYDSCISWTVNPADMTFHDVGFHGKKKIYKVTPKDNHFGTVGFVDVAGGMSGLIYTTLTDNKTFSFSVSCYPEMNEMIWVVASPCKSLPKETIKLIHKHAESLGFKKDYFTGQRYDHCESNDNEGDDMFRRNKLCNSGSNRETVFLFPFYTVSFTFQILIKL